MPATTVRTAYMGLSRVSTTGTVLGNSPTVMERANSSQELRVQPTPDSDNADDYPTLGDYLQREAADGYKAQVITNTIIVTYPA